MSQVDLGQFSCTACNRQYPWKPAYAGRQVKCKCGNVMVAPTEAPKPAAEESDDLLDGLYDLADQEQQAASAGAVDTGLRCPSCQADMLPGETVCPNCNFNLKTGLKQRAQKATKAIGATAAGAGPGSPMLAYAGVNKRSAAAAKGDFANSLGGNPLTELYVPIAAILVGLGMQLVLYGYVAGAWRGVGFALPQVGLALAVNLVLSFVGVAVAGQFLELSFGSPGPAALKLVALCLLPTAIAETIGKMVDHEGGFVAMATATMLMTPLLIGGFMWLYQFAFDEAAYCTVIIWLVNRWAVTFLIALIMTGHLSGSTGVQQSSATIQADKAAAQQVDMPNATEAKEWLGETASHLYDGETHDSSIQLVNDLYAAGAKKCTTMSDHGQGYEMIVQLPSKQAARDKCFAIIKAWETKEKTPAADQTVDEGQAYYTFEFSTKQLSLP